MLKKVLLIGLVIAVVGGGSVYLAFFGGSETDRLSLSATSSPVAAAELTFPGDWRTSADSEVGYRVREKLARLPAKSDAVGRTNDVNGLLSINGDFEVTTLNLVADVTTLKSDESRRDDKIRTLGLESDEFPTATFVMTEPVKVPQKLRDGIKSRVEVTGDLTIHGVTEAVTLTVAVQPNGQQIEVAGSYTFPWDEFGMEPPNVGTFVSVDETATLEFRLLFERV